MSRERKNNLFTQVPAPRVKRNLFDLSHEVKMSGKFGYLYPVLMMEALPGDTIRDEMTALIRLAPMLAPVMHRLDVTTHFFFIPNRLLTNHWETFITGGQDGTETVVLPYINPSSIRGSDSNLTRLMEKGSLWDYLGLPVIDGASPPASLSAEQVSVLPFRAMAKVWNDYYRDPNLGEELDLRLDDQGGVSAVSVSTGILNISQYRRGFEKDYFTSALPWPQRGAQVLMPLAGVAEASDIDYYAASKWYNEDGSTPTAGSDPEFGLPVPAETGVRSMYSIADAKETRVENIESITFDNASTTINDFRRALAIQRWLENNARGGARYVEQIDNHFAVRVPDFRLQRSEYLGGGKQPVQISEVLSTADTSNMLVGEMAGHGLSVGKTNRFTYRCQEHGYILGITSVTMRTAYSQGIPRLFSRADKFDFAWPELANLGEQEILSKELFFSYDVNDDEANDGTFGYIPRYAEYKFMNDRVAGDFRDTLHYWHLGRYFTERPSLDTQFTTIFENGGGNSGVLDDKESNFRRIFSVTASVDYLWMQLYHRLTAKRPLPYFGVPQIV